MRVPLQVLMVLLFVACGVLFGAFNPQAVLIDFHVFVIPASLGESLLVALFLGSLLGGTAVTVGIVWPLRRRLRKLLREAAPTIDASGQRSTPST